MRHQVAQQPCTVGIILAPAEVVFRTEGDPLLHRAQPLLPGDGFGAGAGVDGVVPLALGVVAAIITLSPHRRADDTIANQLGRLVPSGGGAALRPQLEADLARFDHVMNLECLVQVACHGFLEVNVLAGLYRLDGRFRMQRIVRGDDDTINVLPGQHLLVAGKSGAVSSNHPPGFLDPLGPDVADGRLGDVVGLGVLLHQAHMRVQALAPHADVAKHQPVVRTGDVGRGGLAEHARLERRRRRQRSRGAGNTLEEIATRQRTGKGVGLGLHRSFHHFCLDEWTLTLAVLFRFLKENHRAESVV